MKNLFTNFNMKKLLTPLVFIFFFFTFINNINAQSSPNATANSITKPTFTIGCGSLTPGTISGTLVTITNIGDYTDYPNTYVGNCGPVTYQWQTSPTSGPPWTNITGATGQNYNPGTISTSIYYRREIYDSCSYAQFGSVTTFSNNVKFTIYATPPLYTVSVSGSSSVCPNSTVTIQLSGSQSGSTYQYTLYENGVAVPSSMQNGTGSTLTWNVTHNNCNTTYTYTVIEYNTSLTCTTTMTGTPTVTWNDVNAPVWTTAANALDRTLQCNDASGLTAAQALVPVATDNCTVSLSPVKTSGSFVAGSLCPQAGTYTNTWTVTDACGNTSAVYTQTITIVNTQAPTWTTATNALNSTDRKSVV